MYLKSANTCFVALGALVAYMHCALHAVTPHFFHALRATVPYMSTCPKF